MTDVRRKWKTKCLCLILCLTFALSGCGSLLERQYSTVEPHSSKFWESEAAGTLRAETYSDIVNDLLLLIGQHRENATLRLYNVTGDSFDESDMEEAAVEIQQETPLGSFAVSYITFSSQPQRGYEEIKIQIGYRRTMEQIQAIVNATSPEAVYSLLETALNQGRGELAVRIGYWTPDGQAQVEQAAALLREQRGLTETPQWIVSYYPNSGTVGLVEFDLNPPPEAVDEAETEGTSSDWTAPNSQSVPSPDSMEAPQGTWESENATGSVEQEAV